MDHRGSILVVTLAVMLLLVSLVGGFLFAAGTFILHSGWEETDAQALWLAEAGLHKAVWNLKTPAGSGGQGENWTTAGTTEALGNDSYTMVVARWDFALAANGSSASDNPSQPSPAKGPAKAIDGDDGTHWESRSEPDGADPQDLIVTFPYALTINKVRFLATATDRTPEDYTWAVSADGLSYTTVVTVSGNSATDKTDAFVAQSNVTSLRLRVTEAEKRIRIATLETLGSRITATGSIGASDPLTRTVAQTVVADDGSPENQRAYVQTDWVEQ